MGGLHDPERSSSLGNRARRSRFSFANSSFHRPRGHVRRAGAYAKPTGAGAKRAGGYYAQRGGAIAKRARANA